MGVVAKAMPLGELAPRQLRMRDNVAADQEEGGEHAFVLERIENSRRGGGPGAVVEGEHQLLGLQRQGRRELFAADARRAGGIDREHTFGAERVWVAGAGAAVAVGGRRTAARTMAIRMIRIMALAKELN